MGEAGRRRRDSEHPSVLSSECKQAHGVASPQAPPLFAVSFRPSHPLSHLLLVHFQASSTRLALSILLALLLAPSSLSHLSPSRCLLRLVLVLLHLDLFSLRPETLCANEKAAFHLIFPLLWFKEQQDASPVGPTVGGAAV